VTAIPVKREWYMVNGVPIEKSQPKIPVFVPQEGFVIQTDIN
jgi:hypothetical protein